MAFSRIITSGEKLPRVALVAAVAALSIGASVGARAQGGPGAVAAPTASVARTEANLVLYEGEAQLAALAAEGPTVVFFFAAWCPLCQATIKEFSERWTDVRPELTVVIADYDTESALKVRYGISYQDTFVQVAPDLAPIKIWNGGGLDGLNANTVVAGL